MAALPFQAHANYGTWSIVFDNDILLSNLNHVVKTFKSLINMKKSLPLLKDYQNDKAQRIIKVFFMSRLWLLKCDYYSLFFNLQSNSQHYFSTHISIYLSIYSFIYLFIYPFIHSSVHLYIHRFISFYVYISIYLFIYQSIYLYIHPSIHLSI